MLVEVMGTRVLGPVFGVGLFVWAALLSVTLGSLALGYYLGGAWVDRNPSGRSLGTALVAAGGALGLAVVMSSPLLALTQSLGPRVAPIIAATLLFTPCLTFLGMIGPMVVRLAARSVDRAGSGVGHVYALSTLGSLTATLLVSFVLIPAFETNTVLLGAAAALLVNAAACFQGSTRLAVAAASCVPLLLAFVSDPAGRELPEQLRIVERAQSPYSLLEVIDDTARSVRLLRADHSIIGGRFFDSDAPVFGYLRVLEATTIARPEAHDALIVGLGTGSLAMTLQRRGLNVDTVEIDPGVVRLARDHFDFAPRGEVIVEDARTFISRRQRQYDIVVHDAFTGGTTPAHLFSDEVVRGIKNLLRPDGLLAVNFVGFDQGEHAQATWAVWRTLRAAFPVVRVFRDSKPTPGELSVRNLVFFASDAPLEGIPRLPSNAAADFRGWELQIPDEAAQGDLLTDAHNPLPRLQLPIEEAHARAMAKLLPDEVWLP